jgi:multidrug resistance efflux pump
MKGTSFKSLRSGSLRPGRIRTHILPILIWTGAVACVVVLFRHRAQRLEVLGIAQGRVHQIAATCDGRLTDVPVQLFERVSQGQPLAVIDTVLDDENLQAQLATASAEVQRLRAQVVAEQQRLVAEAANQQTDWAATHRRFSVDAENSKLRVLELMTLIETDRAALEGLELDTRASVIQSILDQNDIAFLAYQRARATHNALAKEIEENEHLLKQAKSDSDAAQGRLAEFSQQQPQHPSVDSALEVIHKEIAVQEHLIEELRARRMPLVLKSPVNGIIIPILGNANEVALHRPGENLLRRPGEVIAAGDPIFAVAEIEPREIVAYIEERQLAQVREGIEVEVVKNTKPAQIARSQITYVSPVVEQIPERLWANPTIPQWGRAILVEIHPDLELVPGEIVGIRGL